jgi:hypothetical protein
MNVSAIACAHRGDRLHLSPFVASLERMNGVGIIEAWTNAAGASGLMFGFGMMGFSRQGRMKDTDLHGSFQSSKGREA